MRSQTSKKQLPRDYLEHYDEAIFGHVEGYEDDGEKAAANNVYRYLLASGVPRDYAR